MPVLLRNRLHLLETVWFRPTSLCLRSQCSCRGHSWKLPRRQASHIFCFLHNHGKAYLAGNRTQIASSNGCNEGIEDRHPMLQQGLPSAQVLWKRCKETSTMAACLKWKRPIWPGCCLRKFNQWNERIAALYVSLHSKGSSAPTMCTTRDLRSANCGIPWATFAISCKLHTMLSGYDANSVRAVREFRPIAIAPTAPIILITRNSCAYLC